MNKKGSVFTDIILIPFVILVVVVSLFLGYYLYNKVLTDTDLFTRSNATDEVQTAMTTVTNMFPYIFIMIIASIIVVLAITGYYVPVAPIFLVAGIVITIIAIIVAVPISNFYEELRGHSDFETTSSEFTIVNLLMDNLVYLVLFGGGIFLLVMYAKRKDTGGGFGGYA